MKQPLPQLGIILSILFVKGDDVVLNRHLSLPAGLSLKWSSQDSQWITLEISGPTKGYLSVGFSPTGNMAGSDIYIGWVDSRGRGHLKDYFAKGNEEPILDPKQDVQLISASETDSGTTIRFRRLWDTCDSMDFIIGEDTMKVIWAWSEDDPVEFNNGDNFRVPYHENSILKRGVSKVFMKTRPMQRPFPDEEIMYPKDVKQMDITVSNVKVENSETYYHCKIVKFQKLPQKHHIIGYRPLIGEESVGHVHQVSLYDCEVPPEVEVSDEYIFERFVDHPGGDCFSSETPTQWRDYCSTLHIPFGVGSEGILFPDHIGHSIGQKSHYFKLEIHYENPNAKYLLDNSGIRLFYTKNLRQFESELLFTGHRRTPFLTIPPRQKQFSISGFCSAECTRNGFGAEGIKIVAVLFHTHLAGRQIILRHIRNGRELPLIAYDKHMEFNYQHFRMLEKEVKVLPGDDLITECTYDTSDNKAFIFGGLSTRREVCESFIIYYPKSSLVDCRSQPEFYQYLGALGVMNATGHLLQQLNLPHNTNHTNLNYGKLALDDSILLEGGKIDQVSDDIFKDILITNPQRLRNKFIGDHILSLEWNDDFFAKLVEQKWRVGPHYMHCAAQGRRIIQAKFIVGFPKMEQMEDMMSMSTDTNTCLMYNSLNNFAASISVSTHFLLYPFILILLFIRQYLVIFKL